MLVEIRSSSYVLCGATREPHDNEPGIKRCKSKGIVVV